MAQPSQSNMLTASEALAVQEALANVQLMNGLMKIFGYDQQVHSETIANEALATEPNVYRIVQGAQRYRSAKEWVNTIKSRLETLTVKQTRG